MKNTALIAGFISLVLLSGPVQAVKIFQGSANYGAGLNIASVAWTIELADVQTFPTKLDPTDFTLSEFSGSHTVNTTSWGAVDVLSATFDAGSLGPNVPFGSWLFEVDCGASFSNTQFVPCKEVTLPSISVNGDPTVRAVNGGIMPEPATAALLGAGFLGLSWLRRNRS